MSTPNKPVDLLNRETFTSIELIDPKKVEGKVLILKSGSRNLDAAAVTREMQKIFPGLSAQQILIMPNDYNLLALPRRDLVATLRGYLRRFETAADRRP